MARTLLSLGTICAFVGVHAMRQHQCSCKFSETVTSAVIGAICGGMLAFFGNLVSSSTLLVTATIISAAVLGEYLGRFWGAVNGAILGGMLTAVGGVIGGSEIGVMCTVGTCALLGGWLRWCSRECGNDCPRRSLSSASPETVEPPTQPLFDAGWHEVRGAIRPAPMGKSLFRLIHHA